MGAKEIGGLRDYLGKGEEVGEFSLKEAYDGTKEKENFLETKQSKLLLDEIKLADQICSMVNYGGCKKAVLNKLKVKREEIFIAEEGTTLDGLMLQEEFHDLFYNDLLLRIEKDKLNNNSN